MTAEFVHLSHKTKIRNYISNLWIQWPGTLLDYFRNFLIKRNLRSSKMVIYKSVEYGGDVDPK